MEKNKRRFAGRFFWFAIGALFIIRAGGYVRDIRDGRESIALCRKELKDTRILPPGHLSRLEVQLAELRALETPAGTPQSASQAKNEDPVGMIRKALRGHAIGVERLRTLSMGGATATEFVLSSAPVNFLRFLQGAAELPLPLNYVSIKPNAHTSAIDVTVRFSHAQ
jgi:type II secretory pathway component PulM